MHHLNYNCVATDVDGTEHKLYANWLHNENLDHWLGWHCDAGVTRLYLDVNGNVYDGECKNTKLGHIEGDWQLKKSENSICQLDRCTGCTDDLLTKKYR